MKDQTVEIVISFIISILLIAHFLFQPESAMMKAVVRNDVTKMQQMIRMSGGLDKRSPCPQIRSSSTTPLIAAAWLGRTEILMELVNAGANVNARDSYGTTPLLAALSRGDIPSAFALLERGADPNLATCLGHGSCTTSLRCAQRLNNAQLIHKIETLGGREDTPFFFLLECFWMDIRPVAVLIVTQIVPLVLFVMISGSLLRLTIKRHL
jgi:hypothetical protein